jgi:PhzF family phenazine biosynthesis protein
MTIDVKVINAFAVDGKGGNPAGIILNADGLTRKQMQAIASRLAFPESAFISKSDVADFKLDFFTPTKQIPHCGHATIGTFAYLKKNGSIPGMHSSKETIDGTRRIFFKDGLAYMEQQKPVFKEVPEELSAILSSLRLSTNELIDGGRPFIVNTGNSFLIIPVKDENTLARVQPDFDAIAVMSERYNLIGYYLFAPSKKEKVQATARMFAPYYGIPEEAATGMAAGPLACYLHTICNIERTQFLVEQGRFMAEPSPSLLYVNLSVDGASVQNLYVGGDAYVSQELSLSI